MPTWLKLTAVWGGLLIVLVFGLYGHPIQPDRYLVPGGYESAD